MKPPPGYVKRQVRMGFDHEALTRYPQGYVRQMIAEATGDLLTKALIEGDIDTTAPLFIDGAQKVYPTSFFFDDLAEVKVELLYMQRDRSRDHPALAQGHRAIDG
jgi:hypothetical protein